MREFDNSNQKKKKKEEKKKKKKKKPRHFVIFQPPFDLSGRERVWVARLYCMCDELKGASWQPFAAFYVTL